MFTHTERNLHINGNVNWIDYSVIDSNRIIRRFTQVTKQEKLAIKTGDLFNVYAFNSAKFGYEYKGGNLIEEIEEFGREILKETKNPELYNIEEWKQNMKA